MPAKMKAERAPRRVPKVEPKLDPVDEALLGLTTALQRAFQMTEEDAASVADTIQGCFAGAVEVNDEAIDAQVRSLFYTLEGRRILCFRREDYETAEGQKRRGFWWRIRPEVVAELAAPTPLNEDVDVYASLPTECWTRRDVAAEA